MANRTTLKSYFETGDKPTQAQFAALIDSVLNLSEDDYTTVPGLDAVLTGIEDDIPTELPDLSDVTINSPATNQALIWNGTQWVNAGIVSAFITDAQDISGLTNYTSNAAAITGGLVAGDLYKYNDGTRTYVMVVQ